MKCCQGQILLLKEKHSAKTEEPQGIWECISEATAPRPQTPAKAAIKCQIITLKCWVLKSLSAQLLCRETLCTSSHQMAQSLPSQDTFLLPSLLKDTDP